MNLFKKAFLVEYDIYVSERDCIPCWNRKQRCYKARSKDKVFEQMKKDLNGYLSWSLNSIKEIDRGEYFDNVNHIGVYSLDGIKII